MRALTIALLLTACAGIHAATIADLAGTWSIDADATWDEWQKRPEFANIPDEMKATIRQNAMAMMGTMTWEVTGDTVARSEKGKVVETTPFTVVATEGDVLTIENTGPDGTKQAGRFELRGEKLAISGGDEKNGGSGMLILKRGVPAPAAAPAAVPAATPAPVPTPAPTTK